MQYGGIALNDLGQDRRRIEFKLQVDAEPCSQRAREVPGPGRGAYQRKGLQIDLERPCSGPFSDDYVKLVVLHRRIEHFLYDGAQAVYLIYEKHISGLKRCEDGSQIACFLESWSGSRLEVHAKLICYDVRKRCLAKPGRPVDQHVIKRLGSLFRGMYGNRQLLLDLVLSAVVTEDLRPCRLVDELLIGICSCGGNYPVLTAFRRSRGDVVVLYSHCLYLPCCASEGIAYDLLGTLALGICGFCHAFGICL